MKKLHLVSIAAAFGALNLTAQAQISGFGGAYTLNNDGTGSATIVDANTLQLTDKDTYGEANSVYNDTQQSVGAFTAAFTYTLAGFNNDTFSPADGFTFVLQNDNLNALGIAGADLGYSNSQDNTQPGVENSVALAFNIYGPNGVGENLLTDGNNPFSYNSTSPVDITSGDPIRVVITYSGTTLVEQLTDTSNTSLTYTNIYTGLDIAGTVGGSAAWVGFTAANSAGSGTQVITDFSYTPSSTPEPATTALLVGGILAAMRRRRLRA